MPSPMEATFTAAYREVPEGSIAFVKKPKGTRKSLIGQIAIFSALLSSQAFAGVNTWTTGGPEGGSINSLVIDPSTSAVLYAATAGSGVYKSVNGGISWRSITSGLTHSWVSALAIDPSNQNTIYASNPSSCWVQWIGACSSKPSGVFKSVNGGESWASVNSGVDVLSLVIDPSAPATIYLGTYSGGILRSTNGGQSWTDLNAGLGDKWVTALAIDPSTPTTLYAGTQLGDGGVFKSTNSGQSWTAINTGLLTTHIERLVIDPSTPATVYVGTRGGGVFRSTDGGQSWTAINSGLPTFSDVTALAVDPSAPATLYAGTNGGGVFKSTNRGDAWTPANSGLAYDYYQGTGYSYVHALAIDPSTPTTLYAGTFYDGGVFKSTSGGRSWAAVNSGLINTLATTLAIDRAAPATLYAGTANAGVFKSTNGGRSWLAANAGLLSTAITSLVSDPTDPATLYAVNYGLFKSSNGGQTWNSAGLETTVVSALAVDPLVSSRLYAGTSKGLFKSTDGGRSWALVNFPAAGVGIHSVAVDPFAPETVYVGTDENTYANGVFKTSDGGQSWNPVTPAPAGTGLHPIVLSLALDTRRPPTLWVAMFFIDDIRVIREGGLYRSADGSQSWTSIRAGVALPGYYVGHFAISPSAPDTLYACTQAGVFKSSNGGLTWTGIGADVAASAIVVDPSDSETVYVAAEVASKGSGVFHYQIVTPCASTRSKRCPPRHIAFR